MVAVVPLRVTLPRPPCYGYNLGMRKGEDSNYFVLTCFVDKPMKEIF